MPGSLEKLSLCNGSTCGERAHPGQRWTRGYPFFEYPAYLSRIRRTDERTRTADPHITSELP
jgi:hypothetical protein